MCTNIHCHLDQNNILGPDNNEFRAMHFTESQLLSHGMLKYWGTGRQIDVAILDFSKAFGTVLHQCRTVSNVTSS